MILAFIMAILQSDIVSEHLRDLSEGIDCVEMDRHFNDVLLLSAAEALRMQKTYLKTRFHLCKCLGFGLKWASVCSDSLKFPLPSALVSVSDAAGLF